MTGHRSSPGNGVPPRVAATDVNRRESELPSEEVLVQLNRILTSHAFRRSNRLRRLLEFIVAQALARNEPGLEAYSIGREVFGKPEDYDPRIDPHVRVGASRLRVKLRQFYETEGLADPITIAISKGSYRPLFNRRLELALPHEPSGSPVSVRHEGTARLSSGFSIVVLPFVDLSPKGDQSSFCDGLTVGVINKLARVEGLRVVARSSAFRFRGAAQDISRIRQQLNVGSIVEGSVRKEGKRLRVTLQLIDASNGYLVWTGEFGGTIDDLLGLQDRIAAALVRLFRARLRARRTISPADEVA